jgi:TRAP-type C4-dicarboxylate transport system substrate-binding protein
MLELGLAPIVGAGVITTKAWKAIPEADRQTLLTAAAGVEKRLQTEVPKHDENAVTAMVKAGLTVTKASGPEWRTQLDNLAKTMRGEQVPPEIFDQASKARDEYRKKKTATHK